MGVRRRGWRSSTAKGAKETRGDPAPGLLSPSLCPGRGHPESSPLQIAGEQGLAWDRAKEAPGAGWVAELCLEQVSSLEMAPGKGWAEATQGQPGRREGEACWGCGPVYTGVFLARVSPRGRAE